MGRGDDDKIHDEIEFIDSFETIYQIVQNKSFITINRSMWKIHLIFIIINMILLIVGNYSTLMSDIYRDIQMKKYLIALLSFGTMYFFVKAFFVCRVVW